MKPTPILILVLFAVAALIAWRSDKVIHADKGRLQVYHDGDAVVLSWRSGIDVPMARRFEEAFAEWGPKTDRFVIALHSPGGALTEGRAVIEHIQRQKRSHQVDTYVGSKEACLSMCVPIFLQGDGRFAASDSVWMFHEPSTRDAFTDEEINRPGFEERRTTRKFFNRYFVNSEMDPAWRNALAEQWQGEDIWKTGAQLVEEGSNIITRLE